MGAASDLSGLLLACVGAARRRDGPLCDPIWARAWHRHTASNALGPGLSRPLVRIPETDRRPLRRLPRLPDDRRRWADLGFRRDDAAAQAARDREMAEP